MRRILHRYARFYSNIIKNFIGIFIFVGMLAVVFGDYGWFPNKNIYAISQFVYKSVIPILIAYASGSQMYRTSEDEDRKSVHTGGIIAVMAVSGMILQDEATGLFGAMILGPLSGLIWGRVLQPTVKRVNSELEMLIQNLVLATAGSIFAIIAFFVISPLLGAFLKLLLIGCNFLIEYRLIGLLSFIIEPAKVLFLNNSVNHGILLPLGLQQAEMTGQSILFLLEANPGPGLGILLALYICKKKKRKDYATSIFAQSIGGVHEVYFPEALENIWLLVPLVAGGVAGTLCFSILQVGTVAPVTPGSLLILFLVTRKLQIVGVLTGVIISTAVSAGSAIFILKLQKENEDKKLIKIEEKTIVRTPIKKIGIVCDAGVGSSAMGAALLRRKLREMNLEQITVQAFARDQIPESLDLVVCQRNLYEIHPFEVTKEKLRIVEGLLNQSEYMVIASEIKERNEVQI